MLTPIGDFLAKLLFTLILVGLVGAGAWAITRIV